jgi:hypothetical protein
MSTKIGLIKISGNRIVSVVYMESKFERELGDEINYLGSKHIVAVIGGSRDEIVSCLNKFISKQNSIIRRQRAAEDKAFNIYWNKVMRGIAQEMENDFKDSLK